MQDSQLFCYSRPNKLLKFKPETHRTILIVHFTFRNDHITKGFRDWHVNTQLLYQQIKSTLRCKLVLTIQIGNKYCRYTHLE